jgi:homogentisate 1,2-dioxygenase
MDSRKYQNGFGNHFATEAVPGALPEGRNSPHGVVTPPDPMRWMVAEDTFRPPWYRRNLMSEFMGLMQCQYDAKEEGFVPGGASLHNCMVPHGPDSDAFAKASTSELKPHKLENTLAFMFESRYRFVPTAFAMNAGMLDHNSAACWANLQDNFKP